MWLPICHRGACRVLQIVQRQASTCPTKRCSVLLKHRAAGPRSAALHPTREEGPAHRGPHRQRSTQQQQRRWPPERVRASCQASLSSSLQARGSRAVSPRASRMREQARGTCDHLEPARRRRLLIEVRAQSRCPLWKGCTPSRIRSRFTVPSRDNVCMIPWCSPTATRTRDVT